MPNNTWRTVAMPDCYQCGKPIARTGGAVMVAPGKVQHNNSRCPSHGGDSRPLHALVHPDCPESWHDLWDHASLVFLQDDLAQALAAIGWDGLNTAWAKCEAMLLSGIARLR